MKHYVESIKTYLEYFTVSLLKQKIDSFDLIISTKKFKIIIDFFFSKNLKTLKIYFEMIKYLRDYIFYYVQKLNVLNQRKTILLKKKSDKKSVKKFFNVKTLFENSNQNEINFYEQLRKNFSRFSWLIHYDILKKLFANINTSNQNIKIMIYHLNKKKHMMASKIIEKKNVESILFLFKMLIDVESKYRFIKFKMTTLLWIVQRIAHMIKSLKYSTVIYINHEANLVITIEIKLNTININKLNLKLIRISIYLFQFRLNVKHRFENFNVISNAFNRLSIAKNKIKKYFENRRKKFRFRLNLNLQYFFD